MLNEELLYYYANWLREPRKITKSLCLYIDVLAGIRKCHLYKVTPWAKLLGNSV
jgi:hypothetical protein